MAFFVDHLVFGARGKLGFIVLVWLRVLIQSIFDPFPLQNICFLSFGIYFGLLHTFYVIISDVD